MARRILTGWRNSAKLVVAATFLLVACGGGNPPSPTPSAAPTATARVSIQQPTATATVEPPATATDVPLTARPTLPPPPSRPEQPAPAEGRTLTGGQWYVLRECIVFYLPQGWDFNLHGAVIDPGGQLSLGFEDVVSGSSLVFDAANLGKGLRTVYDPSLNAAFDQIEATIRKLC